MFNPIVRLFVTWVAPIWDFYLPFQLVYTVHNFLFFMLQQHSDAFRATILSCNNHIRWQNQYIHRMGSFAVNVPQTEHSLFRLHCISTCYMALSFSNIHTTYATNKRSSLKQKRQESRNKNLKYLQGNDFMWFIPDIRWIQQRPLAGLFNRKNERQASQNQRKKRNTVKPVLRDHCHESRVNDRSHISV